MIYLFWLCLSPFLAHAATIQTLQTPRGAKILVTTSLPRGKESAKAPVLIYAPDRICGEKALTETVTDTFVENGWIVVTMEYGYCVTDPTTPKPSLDLNAESEDFETAYRALAKIPRADKNHLFFAGKSMGGRVAYRAFEGRPGAVAAAVLGPYCTPPEFDDNYPNFTDETRPMALLWGNQDPNCPSGVLFRHLRLGAGNVMPMEFAGNHDFNVMDADGKVDPSNSHIIHQEVAAFLQKFFRRQLPRTK